MSRLQSVSEYRPMGHLVNRCIGCRVSEMRAAIVQLKCAIHQLRRAELVVAILHLQLLVGTTDVLGNAMRGCFDAGSGLKPDASD